MNKENRHRLADIEIRLTVARGAGVQGLVQSGEGIQRCKLVVPEYSGDVKDSTGNTVSGTVITMCGARWILEI